ncbi:DUF1758 domain-containing protein [Trichonephila clavipes]|nr:DUF1758 domain-containing protein [Trichonephila clavipes]
MEALINRYENKRALVDIHSTEMLSVPKVQSENPVQLRLLIDTVRSHLRSLKNLRMDSNVFSDAILLHLLNSKIDRESQRLFQLNLKTTEVPSLQDFFSFLETTRCIQLESIRKTDCDTKNIPVSCIKILTFQISKIPPSQKHFLESMKKIKRVYFLSAIPVPRCTNALDLKIFPYKKEKIYGDRFNSCQVSYSQFGLAIHQNDHQARRRFVEWAQNEIAVVPDFHKRILFSGEAHFWLNGYDNKQNCRIWSEANPQVYVETPLHPEKLTVWCALWAGGILLQKR